MTEVDSYPRFQSIRRFGSLDSLRGLAIGAVIVQHTPPLPHQKLPFTDAGASGVALFFTLSGFLITTLLLREEQSTGTISLRDFYIRRTLRIFPLYYAILLFYTILVLLLEHNAAGRLFIHNLPYFLTYTSNWFVDLIVNEDGQRRVIFIFAWSLATEEQFYLFWPFLLKYLRRHAAASVLIIVLIVELSLKFLFGRADIPQNTWDRVLRIATSPSTEICAGALMALALHSPSGFSALWKLFGRRWCAPLAALLALGVLLWPGDASESWYLAVAIAFAILVTTCVIREDHGLARVLKTPFLTRIGIVSYGMYMLLMLAVNSVKAAETRAGLHNQMLQFILALSLAYIAAEISFRYFESPILRFKERFQHVGMVPLPATAKGNTE